MNTSIIRYIIGSILKAEAIFLLLPCLTAVIYRETQGLPYLITAILCGLLGIFLTIHKPKDYVFYLKEGCVATSLSWIAISIFGCLPFILTGEIPSFTNALFETISGFTTTGASILSDVEALSHCSLIWRSFTHWIGGMGVLVFIIAVIPMSGGSHINLMRAESPGPSVGKLVPKVKYTARILYLIYFVMTILEIVILCIGKMPLFDAINTGFSTAGTCGFGIKNDSMASYPMHIQWIVTIFMILFGINFNAYYYLLYRKVKKFLRMEETRYYLLFITLATLIIFYHIISISENAYEAITDAAFQVASIISSTGYSTLDYEVWPEICKMAILCVMFIGASAGSTGGGIKVSRIVIMAKTVIKELNSYIHPKCIKKINFEAKPVEHEVIRSINVYFITYTLIFFLSALLISMEGIDFISTFTSVAATINNTGPGFGCVGPAHNFGGLSILSKYVLIFDMLAGRLELFPLLILFHPVVWKNFIIQKLQRIKK